MPRWSGRSGARCGRFEGDERLTKLTWDADIARAEALLGQRVSLTGHGFDVHRLELGEELWLCGVRIEHDRGLSGHSDADVGLHALTDALLGAIAAGDIGDHFPPTDQRWRGARSERFLAHAADLAREAGARLEHLDVTLVCEAPKIGPHKAAMRQRIAEIVDLPVGRVSVKATTTEALGFTGRPRRHRGAGHRNRESCRNGGDAMTSFLPPALLVLAHEVVRRNREAGCRIALAESCTGGLCAAAITEVAGSSEVFESSFVTYANEAKIRLLGVEEELIATFGAVLGGDRVGDGERRTRTFDRRSGGGDHRRGRTWRRHRAQARRHGRVRPSPGAATTPRPSWRADGSSIRPPAGPASGSMRPRWRCRC